ncbi:MAG TPA: hypothetical protein VF527_05170 [Pyrinomonadaceae bacterium]|jgi:hypothetical protein
MNRMWVVLAAVPLALIAWMLYGFWTRPSAADTASPLTCVLILAGAVATGIYVLSVVLAGWWRGRYSLRRADVLAATTLASLDVIIPTALVVIIWLLVRSLKNHPIIF